MTTAVIPKRIVTPFGTAFLVATVLVMKILAGGDCRQSWT